MFVLCVVLCCVGVFFVFCFFFSSRRRHTRSLCDWSSDVCSSDLGRSGELGPRLATDRSLWDDPFPAYDEMRAQGDLVEGRIVYATASHAVASEVLRSPVFRVGVNADSLPPLARRMLALAVDARHPGPAEPP